MGDYPPEVQSKLDILETYLWDDDLEEVDILHLYPEMGLAFSQGGYWDARFFRLVGYHESRRLRRDFGRHDALTWLGDNGLPDLKGIMVYADGSTVVIFNQPVRPLWGQNIYTENA